LINKQKQMSSSSKFFNILQEQGFITHFTERYNEFANRLKGHSKFLADNARP
jgi:hypothetical protein